MTVKIHKVMQSVLQQNFLPVNVGGQPNQTPPTQTVNGFEVTSLLPIAKPKKYQNKSGHTRPRQPAISLDQPGRLRVSNLLAILNISHSTLYAGLKSGRYPSPDGQDGSFPFWRTSTIRVFLES